MIISPSIQVGFGDINDLAKVGVTAEEIRVIEVALKIEIDKLQS